MQISMQLDLSPHQDLQPLHSIAGKSRTMTCAMQIRQRQNSTQVHHTCITALQCASRQNASFDKTGSAVDWKAAGQVLCCTTNVAAHTSAVFWCEDVFW